MPRNSSLLPVLAGGRQPKADYENTNVDVETNAVGVIISGRPAG